MAYLAHNSIIYTHIILPSTVSRQGSHNQKIDHIVLKIPLGFVCGEGKVLHILRKNTKFEVGFIVNFKLVHKTTNEFGEE